MRSEADEKRIRERWRTIMAYVIATKSQGQLLDSKDRKSTRLNSSHEFVSRMPSSA